MCDWKPDFDNDDDDYWETNCGKIFRYDEEFVFCPGCGKKIYIAQAYED